MVLPALLDGAPRRRIAARKRSRPPGRVHRTLACGPASARARVLPAKGNTGIHDPVKVPTAAYFREFTFHALGRIRARERARARRLSQQSHSPSTEYTLPRSSVLNRRNPSIKVG